MFVDHPAHRPSFHRPGRRLVRCVAAAVLTLVLGCSESVRERTPEPSGAEVTGKADAVPDGETDVIAAGFHDPGYVGSAACAACHAGICEDFVTHPMARSLAAVADSKLEPYDQADEFAVHSPDGTTGTVAYRVSVADDGRVLHHEVRRTPDGEVLYDHAVPAAFAIGSGARGRSYIVRRGSRFAMSPVTWYSSEDKWDLSPGYDEANQHFNRPIQDDCLFCHAGTVNEVPEIDHAFGRPAFFEESIGCERCHGPGREHIAIHESLEAGAAAPDDPIVNPADLSPHLRNQVCFSCHLTGEVRQTQPGREPWDFRPGDELSDVMAVFVKQVSRSADAPMEAVGHVEQMVSSPCFIKSGGEMTCVQCHDPHRMPSESEKLSIFRAACVSCHDPADPADVFCSVTEDVRREKTPEDSCVACHMPSRPASDVPHTSQTDHRILRDGLAALEAGGTPEASGVELFRRGGEVSPAEASRAGALAALRNAETAGDRETAARALPLLERAAAAFPQDAEVRSALGVAYAMTGDLPKAAAALQSALQDRPKDAAILRRLVTLGQTAGKSELAADYARRLAEANPNDASDLGQASFVLGTAGDLTTAAELGERALELDPSSSRVHLWLADVYGRLGDAGPQAEHRAMAAQLAR